MSLAVSLVTRDTAPFAVLTSLTRRCPLEDPRRDPLPSFVSLLIDALDLTDAIMPLISTVAVSHVKLNQLEPVRRACELISCKPRSPAFFCCGRFQHLFERVFLQSDFQAEPISLQWPGFMLHNGAASELVRRRRVGGDDISATILLRACLLGEGIHNVALEQDVEHFEESV